jgi:ATP-dependent Lon protease
VNEKFKRVFGGKIVNKRLTTRTGVDQFPRYVLEYLIDNYCTEENFEDDLQKVVKRLRENFVHGAEAEKIRHMIRETRNHSIIANLEVRLQETEDKYWGSIAAINESFVNVTEGLVRQYPMLLSGGMWGTINLTYDETEVYNKKIRPFKVVEFTRFQIAVIDLAEYVEKRREFSADEWLDILVNSVGLNPEPLSRREKLLYLLRMVPLVEQNTNTIELAPRETGKTYLYRNISYYAHVLSGGKATPASLFINNATGRVGVVGTRDAVVFDEIANTDFTDPKALVSIMQGYMQDARFSRGKKENLAFASIVLVGNLDVQSKLLHEKYYHLFEPLPAFLQVEAFIDRLHAYVPGWEIPKIGPDSVSQDYGFITDYFCEIMHELRRSDVLGGLRSRFQLVDTSATGSGVTGRDIHAVEKVLSGLVKLLYPHGELGDEELSELLLLAVEGRQRVRNQLHLMAPGEYGPTVLGATLERSGRTIVPDLADAHREQRVNLPRTPRVGEVIGLAVIGEDRGCILHFELQASGGSGRIIPLGSMQRVMKESVAAAAQFLKVNAKALGLPANWTEDRDVAVLATMMALPKEGPSAGITIVTGIVSALTNRRVRHNLAMTGEIPIMGKVLGVGGILPKLQAAIDAGCAEVIVPKENERDVAMVPSYLRDRIRVHFVSSIEEVLTVALLP